MSSTKVSTKTKMSTFPPKNERFSSYAAKLTTTKAVTHPRPIETSEIAKSAEQALSKLPTLWLKKWKVTTVSAHNPSKNQCLAQKF